MVKAEIQPPEGCTHFSSCETARTLVADQQEALSSIEVPITEPTTIVRCAPHTHDTGLQEISSHSIFRLNGGERKMTISPSVTIKCPHNSGV